MSGALLQAMFVIAGAGYWQVFTYPDVARCELDRPRLERDMHAHGRTAIVTRCEPVSAGQP